MKEGSVYSSYIANISFNALLSCTAIMSNSVTIHAIRKTSSLPKTLKTLLLSLAVSDLGVGLLVHPLYIAYLFIEQNARNYQTFYGVYRTTAMVFSYASFFGVIFLSLDRFLAIHLHLRYQELVTDKRVVAAVISTWMLSTFPPLVMFFIPRDIAFVIFSIFHGVLFLIPGILNWKVYKAARRHAHQIQALQMQRADQLNAEIVNVSRLRKSAFTAIFVYLVFLVCYLPNICISWFLVYKPSLIVRIIKRYTLTLILLNSSLNPLIYCWKMRDIRHAVMNLLRNAFSDN